MDEQRALRRALAGFLGDAATPESNGDSPLTVRETEVLASRRRGPLEPRDRLVARVSEHTVHRHVANVLRKLGQSSRAAAAASATRAGLI
jgi:DNA-binding NarL/FixJ family response regulator